MVRHVKEISGVEAMLVSSDHGSGHPVDPKEGAAADLLDRQLLVVAVSVGKFSLGRI